MSYQTIDYFKDLPVGLAIRDISFYPWHRHQDVLEILYVLKGDLDITMSCEHFVIREGDIAVMNNRTFHNIKSIGGENRVVSLYLDLEYFEKYYQYIKYTIFILEPRKYDDLQKRAVREIKTIINKIIHEMNAGQNDGSIETIKSLAGELMELLVTNFNEVRYYNKKIKLNSLKMERYSLMMKYLNEKFSEKNLLEDISKKEFFCKSYLLHLFRDVSTFSLKDTICFIRNWKSEELLLTTKKSIGEISDECGYSDPKYYYRHFKKWYRCTPSEYRRNYSAELNSTPIFRDVSIRDIELESGENQNTSKRQDNFSNRNYALVYHFDAETISEKAVDSCLENDLSPCIAIRYQNRPLHEWKMMINQCIEAYGHQMKRPEFWISYDNIALAKEVDLLIDKLESSLTDIKIKSLMFF